MGYFDTIVSDAKGRTEMMNFGKVSALDGMQSVAFFSAVAVEFGGVNIKFPTGGETALGLSDTWFSLGSTGVSYAVVIALALVLVQLVQSARMVGRNNDIDIRGYIDGLPTGLSLALLTTIGLHISALFMMDITILQDIYDVFTDGVWRQYGTTLLMTISYIAISREN